MKEAQENKAVISDFEQLSIESKRESIKDLGEELNTKEYSNFEVQRRDYYHKKLFFENLSEYDYFKLIIQTFS